MKPLDYLNLCYIWLKSYPSLVRIWQKAAPPKDGPVVSYGHERVPGPDEHVFGGMVKLQDLNRSFPHCSKNPNILYLVSSALPYFPIRLTKLAKNAGAKIVVNQNGVAYPGWYGKGYQRANKNMSCLHSMADYVLYQSQFCKVSAEKYLGKRDTENSSDILYNPVDTSVFRPLSKPDKKKSDICILLAGSHWTTYRVYTALETLQHVHKSDKSVRLKISGRFCWNSDHTVAEEQVFKYAEKLGVASSVTYTGTYTQDEAPALLNESSLLLHTKYNDPCPRLVVEAMSCGLPVVYSATGGVKELVGEKAGFGVEGPVDWLNDHPPQPEKLAECVIDVIGKLPEVSAVARKRAVEKFDVNSWLNRHETVFHDLLKS